MAAMVQVFISYETIGGLGLAYGVFGGFIDHGIHGWVWHLHRQPGADTFIEMADALFRSDSVVFICTEGTAASDGQTREIGQAESSRKPIYVLATDPKYIHPALRHKNYTTITLSSVADICARLGPFIKKPATVPPPSAENKPIHGLSEFTEGDQ